MKVSATALPRKSASATGLLSCEVKEKGGAGPMTGKGRSPPAECAGANTGIASSASARTRGMRRGLPRPACGERVGVRGIFIRIAAQHSRLQLAFELVEETANHVVSGRDHVEDHFSGTKALRQCAMKIPQPFDHFLRHPRRLNP